MSQTITPTPAQVSAKQVNIHTRSQHSRGSSAHRFGGPDTYVAVTITPAGVLVPYVLRKDVLTRRGIEIRYCGEGYSRHSGPRSMLGQAYSLAQQIAAEVQ